MGERDSHTLSADWPEHWKSSLEKWQNILDKVLCRIPFDEHLGWEDLRVQRLCGYCDEFLNIGCDTCPLCQRKQCYINLTWDEGSGTPFWMFLEIMKELSRTLAINSDAQVNNEWLEAEKLARAMIAAIELDRPQAA